MCTASAGELHAGGSVACFTDKTQKLVTNQVMSRGGGWILDETQEAVDYQRVRAAVSAAAWQPGRWWPAAHPAREGQSFPRHTGAACLRSRESSLGPGLSPSSVRGTPLPAPRPSHAFTSAPSCSK